MAKLNYERDVKTLVNKLNPQFESARNCKLKMRNINEQWSVLQVGRSGEDTLITGTLRECYSFLLGMAEFLI